MAIDPDVQILTDDLEARLAVLESAPGAPAPVDIGVRFATESGDDTNSGLSWESGLSTPQAAYDSLPPEGGVVMFANKGRFDVVDGLNLDRAKRVVFTSHGRGGRTRNHPGTLNAPRLFSSTGAPALVNFDAPIGVYSNGYGFEFSNMDFEISPTTTAALRATDTSFTRVLNCGFFYAFDAASKPGFTAIESVNTMATLSHPGADSSWWRVKDNYVQHGALLSATGYAVNQWTIADNVVFPGDNPTPMIYLEKAHRCVIRDNNLEGGAAPAGIHLKGSWANRLDGNSGERTDPFILLEDSNANTVIDIGIPYPRAGGVDRTLIRLTGASGDNLIIASVGSRYNDLYSNANWIDDQSIWSNWFIAPSSSSASERVFLSEIHTP